MLNDDQWKLIDDQYGMLMKKICHKISGDNATANFDDNFQDLQMAALEAVMGYEKQNGGQNGKFDDFWGAKGFDRYIKTCLWTKKNNKGAKITKKSSILKGTVSTEMEEVLQMEECTGDPDVAIALEEIAFYLTPIQQELISMVVQDPTLVKPNGKINVKKVSENLNTTWFEADKQIKHLSAILENEL